MPPRLSHVDRRLPGILAGGLTALLVTGAPAAASSAKTMAFAGACTTGKTIDVAVAGDLLFHGRLQRQAYARRGGAASLFSPRVRHLIGAADIAYANFEGPAAQGTAGFGRRVRDPGRRFDGTVYASYPAFNFHPSMIGDLRGVGFDVLSTANNHSLDRGTRGVRLTLSNMLRAGIVPTGTRKTTPRPGPPSFGGWARYVDRKGFRTAWLACAEMTNGLPDRRRQVLSCRRDRTTMIREIKRLRARHDVDAIFVTPHWGEENKTRPAARQRRMARDWVEAGTDAVIGTHPHVAQPWERIVRADGTDALVMYSTGNFISGQVRLMQRAGLLGIIRLVRPSSGRTRIQTAGYVPTWVSFRRGRVVGVNAAREGRAARRAMRRILPAGNEMPGRTPFKPPQTCDVQQLLAAIPARAGDHHPAPRPLRGVSMLAAADADIFIGGSSAAEPNARGPRTGARNASSNRARRQKRTLSSRASGRVTAFGSANR